MALNVLQYTGEPLTIIRCPKISVVAKLRGPGLVFLFLFIYPLRSLGFSLFEPVSYRRIFSRGMEVHGY